MWIYYWLNVKSKLLWFFFFNRQTLVQVLLLNWYQELKQGNFMVCVTEEARADNNPFWP